MTPLGAGLALLIGITLGLLGGGGSILTVPAFVYAIGLEPKRAIAMSLPVVGGAAAVGAFQHWRRGGIALRTALPFGAAAMTGAFLGARLAGHLDGRTQLGLLGVTMLAAATSMLRSAGRPAADTPVNPRPTAPAAQPMRGPWSLPLIGVGVGALTGLVGAGGGFLIVPALVILGGLPMREAVGTSLLVISMNTTAAFAGYRGTIAMDWGLVLPFGGLTAVGILVGAQLITRVPARALKIAFAVLLVLIGALILWQNAHA